MRSATSIVIAGIVLIVISIAGLLL